MAAFGIIVPMAAKLLNKGSPGISRINVNIPAMNAN